MTNLPGLPNVKRKLRRQVTAFLGLNWTDNHQEGELRDAYGLSSAGYPFLTQRDPLEAVSGYSSPTDLFAWDGKLAVVDGGVLYYDGNPVINVTEGKKQFAVVNTKLCVFPDKIFVDITNNEFGRLDDSATGFVSGGISTNGISAAREPMVREHVFVGGYAITSTEWNPGTYTYGTDKSQINWNETDGWTLPEPDVSGIFNSDHADRHLSIGDIVILEKTSQSFSLVTAALNYGRLPDTAEYNNEGYFGVVSDWGGKDVAYVNAQIYCDIYRIDANPQLSSLFQVGDVVNVTGTVGGYNDGEKLVVTGIDTDTNTVLFADGTFKAVTYYTRIETDKVPKEYELKLTSSLYYRFTAADTMAAGSYLFWENGMLTVWDPEKKAATAVYTTTEASSSSSSYEDIQGYVFSYGMTGGLLPGTRIQRVVPDLDYICESGNRLWGVSDADRTIYASALGAPSQFFDYRGSSTDSYAVAVGSEGDWTGIFAYDNCVLCWKEQTLHKILGSYPAEYYMAEYRIPGIQKGSERSAQVINDVLYYKAPDGVYAYSGSTPVMISRNFGRERLTDGVGGRMEGRYYLSVKDSGASPMVLVYDIAKGLWMKEQETYAESFSLVDGVLYHLSDGAIYRTVPNGGEVIQWMGEFVPFTETAYMRKGYSKLYLRFDMAAGSWFKVEIRLDHRPWQRVFTQSATLDVTRTIPIHLGYCDRFSVRLRGKGKVTVRSMTREFLAGSDG